MGRGRRFWKEVGIGQKWVHSLKLTYLGCSTKKGEGHWDRSPAYSPNPAWRFLVSIQFFCINIGFFV